MSLSATQQQLTALLADQDCSTIALSGRWGTGKSFLWKQVQTDAKDERVQGALYASLFGLASIEDLKIRLLQSAALAATSDRPWKGASLKSVNAALKSLEDLHPAFRVLSESRLLLAPAVLGKKLIVLDDLERKHADLSIDQVLGFIDEFVQQHGARFLLILNSDKLMDPEPWNVLREKVIDQELRLNTSTSEAFEIALALTPSRHAAFIRSSAGVCGLTNIRIIRKVIRVVNTVLGERDTLSDAVMGRVVPSIVLLSAIHYRGLLDGPDFAFVLRRNQLTLKARTPPAIATTDKEQQARWGLLMQNLGIHHCDEFEALVVDYLESGLLEATELSGIIDRYIAEADTTNAAADWRRFLDRYHWDSSASNDQLLADAQALLPQAARLDAGMVSSYHAMVTTLPGGAELADSALDQWIAEYRRKVPPDDHQGAGVRGVVHPRVEAEFDAASARTQAATDAFDACMFIMEHSGWGDRQARAMQAATVQDMELILRRLTGGHLRYFLLKMIELFVQKAMYEAQFGSAMDNFVEACRNIVNDLKAGRLGVIIRRAFDDVKLSSALAAISPSRRDESNGSVQ